MSYNLRTGLIGSGDIDVNVNLNNLDASNITTGVFSVERIDTTGNPFSLNLIPNNIPNSKLDDIAVSKLVGIIDSQNIALTSIPDIPSSKITSGVLDAARLPVIGNSFIATDSIASEKIDIASGAFNSALIPDLGTGKITSGTFNELRLPVIGNTLISNGSIESGKIDTTSGVFNLTLIPNMSASKITSGTLNVLRIPNLPPNSIVGLSEMGVSGGSTSTLSTAIMPLLSAMPGQCTSSQLPSNIEATQVVATSSITSEGELGCEGNFDCEGDLVCDNLECQGNLECQANLICVGVFSCGGNINLGNSTSDTTTCTGDLNVGGHTILGNSNTDQCLIKGKLLSTAGHHVSATYPIMPPGHPSSSGGAGSAPVVYTRKIQVKPSDFMPNDDTTYYNLSTYDAYPTGYGGPGGKTGFGALKSHSVAHELFAYISIPDGYKTTSIKMFAVYLQPHSTTSLSFPMSVTTNPGGVQINVTATKVTMDNSPRVQIGSGTIGNEFSTSATVFNEESYLMVEIDTASVLDGVLGGWVQIEPV